MSSTWKKIGGIKNNDSFTNLNVNTITTDKFTMREAYQGLFTINGDLVVYKDCYINGNAVVKDKLHFGTKDGIFLKGDENGIGINIISPQALLDLSSSQATVLRIQSSASSTTNILTQNNQGYKIELHVDNSYSSINFFHQNGGVIPESQLYYLPKEKSMILKSNCVVFSDQIVLNDNPNNAKMVIQDLSINQLSFLSNVYTNTESTKYRQSVHICSSDASTNVMMKLTNSENKGWEIGGGIFPKDKTRRMGTMGWTDVSGTYFPIQTYVAGNAYICRATSGINTYAPITEKYVLDVNGPMRLGHCEIATVASAPFQIQSVALLGNYGIAVGNAVDNYNYLALITTDGGRHWTTSNLGSLGSFSNLIVSLDDTSSYIYYCKNNEVILLKNNIGVISIQKDSSWSGVVNLTSNDNICSYQNFFAFNNRVYDISNTSAQNFYTVTCVDINAIAIHIDGSKNIYSVGKKAGTIAGGIIEKTTITSSIDTAPIITLTPIVCISNNSFSYTTIKIKETNIIALGGNCISYGKTTSDTGFTNVFLDLGVVLNDVFIYDNSSAIVVGNGCIFYTNSGFAFWTRIDQNLLNQMGNADNLLNPSNNFIHIGMSDLSNTFVLINSSTASKIYLLYAPHLFYPEKASSVLDISGHMTIDGHIRSNQKSIELFTSVNTVSFATNSNQLIMGNTSVYLKGNTNIENNLFLGNALALSNFVSSTNPLLSRNTLKVHRDLWLTGNLVIDGSAQITVTGTGTGSGIALTNGILDDLSGTKQKQFFIHDISESVLDNKGSGFFIYKPTTASISTDPTGSVNNHGFFKISDISENLLSFRSTGDSNVVAMNLPKIKATDTVNNLLVLNTLNSTTFTNTTDNYEIISSLFSTLPISVKGSFVDIVDISMSGNLRLANNLIITVSGNIYNSDLSSLQDICSNIQSQINSCAKIEEPRDVSFSGTVVFSHLSANSIIISNYEVSCLKDICSNIQAQINKCAKIEEPRDVSFSGNVAISKLIVENTAGAHFTITSNELSFLDGITENIQDTLTAIQNAAESSGTVTKSLANIFTAKNTFEDIELSGGTFSILSNANVNVIGNIITPLQLTYLKDICSNIQGQLNDRILWNDTRDISLSGNLVANGNLINPFELGCLNDICSNIQTQLNDRVLWNDTRDISLSGNVVFNNFTLLRSIMVNGNAISPYEFGCLNDICSNIQTQLNDRVLWNDTRDISLSGNVGFYNNVSFLSTSNLVANGNIISPFELSCLNDISSNIQSQLNNRVLWNDTRDISLSGNVVLLSGKILMNPSYTLWTRGNVVMENGNGNVIIGNLTQSTNLYVFGKHTVAGNIIALQDISLQGNLIVNGNSISPTILSYLNGTTFNIPERINQITNDVKISISNPNTFDSTNTFTTDVIVGNSLSVGNNIQLIGTTNIIKEYEEQEKNYRNLGTISSSLYTNGSIYCLGNRLKKERYRSSIWEDAGYITEGGMIFCRDLSLNNIFTLQGNLFVNGNTITPLHLSYLNGVSSNIQEQFTGLRSFSNDTSFNSNVDICGNLLCKGLLSLQGNLFVNGNTITPLHLSYLNGITSNIQEQFTGLRSFSNDTSFNSNVDICGNLLCKGLLRLQGNLFVNGNTITPLHLSYLNGVSSNIQEQLNTGPSSFLNSVSFKSNVDVCGNISSLKTISALNFTSLSDYRIKTNVLPLTQNYIVDLLKPVSYHHLLKQQEDIGFIAHEVQEIYPFLVSGAKNSSDYQSINYTGLIPILVKEIQELKKRVSALEGL